MNGIANTKPVSQRNYGIDLLRLISAFYVIVIHTLYQGGVHEATVPYSYQHYISTMLLIVCFCCVNAFGIISGYVGYRDTNRPTSLTGYLSLWLSVVFYSVVICAVYMVLLPGSVSRKDLISMFFPLTKNLYWYFSSYSLVYFLSPYLNKLLSLCCDRTLKKCFFLICFVVVPLEYLKEAFTMARGYSAVWLLTLYILGAIMKKTGVCDRIPSIFALLSIIVLNFCFFCLNIKLTDAEVFIYYLNFAPNYSLVTPFYLLPAIAYVILFSRLRLPPFLQKLIMFAAPASFFVYIVNVQDTFWKFFMKDRFAAWASGSPAGIFVRTVGFSLAFVAVVVIMDYFRRQLFRLLGIPKILRRISGKYQNGQVL